MRSRIPASMSSAVSLAAGRSGFDMDVSRELRQRLIALIGHQNGLADLDAPAVHPHAQDGMDDIARLKHRLVAGPQADRVLAPIRRIGDADGVADARFLLQPVTLDDLSPGGLDRFGGCSRPYRVEHRVHA